MAALACLHNAGMRQASCKTFCILAGFNSSGTAGSTVAEVVLSAAVAALHPAASQQAAMQKVRQI